MRVLIATGISEPDIGGPATYAANLSQKWPDGNAKVIAFSRQGGRILSRLYFLLRVFNASENFDLIYTLDWFAAGLPAALAAKIRGIPYVVRVGGDYLWERHIASGEKPVTLNEFYEQKFYKKHPLIHGIIRWILQGAAHVIFNTDKQRELYRACFGLKSERISTIYNPVPDTAFIHSEKVSTRKEFVYWGRFVAGKNLETLVRAFRKAGITGYTLTLIGNGPCREQLASLVSKLGVEESVTIEQAMSREEVWNHVKDSRALVLPSWTDISPNVVYEALALQLPALVTKENYLSIRDQLSATIDPNSVDDIAEKLKMLADDSRYASFADAFRSIRFEQSWDDVVRAHETLFQQLV